MNDFVKYILSCKWEVVNALSVNLFFKNFNLLTFIRDS